MPSTHRISRWSELDANCSMRSLVVVELAEDATEQRLRELQTTIQRMPARICFLGTFRDRCPKGSNCPYRHYGGEDPAYTEDALVAVVVEHERNRVATQQPRPVRV